MIEVRRTEGTDLEAAASPIKSDDLPPLVPTGRYVVHALGVEVHHAFRRTGLTLRCEIVEPAAYDGTPLSWYAPLPPHGKRPGPSSKIMRAWILAAGRRPDRGERIAFRVLAGRRYVAIVETVTHSWERDEHRRPLPLPEAARYSVIRTLVERA